MECPQASSARHLGHEAWQEEGRGGLYPALVTKGGKCPRDCEAEVSGAQEATLSGCGDFTVKRWLQGENCWCSTDVDGLGLPPFNLVTMGKSLPFLYRKGRWHSEVHRVIFKDLAV